MTTPANVAATATTASATTASATTASATATVATATTAVGRPLPAPTEVSRPHWDGCRRGELLFQRCDLCTRAVFPPARLCPYCNSGALRWEASSGLGTVYSHSVVHRPQLPVFEAPYVVAVVELEEDWHMFTNIVHPDDVEGSSPDVRVGMPVEVRYVEVADSVLPCFEARA